MKSKFYIHITLLILAISNLTIISFWLDGVWSLSFFALSQKDSFGVTYTSNYSFWQVITYLACFTTGLVFHLRAKASCGGFWNKLSIIVCLLGMVSFFIELSHWLIDFNFSLIVSIPVILLLSGIISGVKIHSTKLDATEGSSLSL